MRRVVILLLVVSCLSAVRADEPIPQSELRAAVEKALPLLEKGAVGHREQRTCFSCHNQGVPILALTMAQKRGLSINQEELTRQLEFIVAFITTNKERFLEGRGTGGQVDTAGYALLALEAGQWKPDEATTAVAEYLLLFQKDQDHWKNSSDRPPTEASRFTTNYVGLLGLKSFATESQQERASARREQIRTWLRATEAKDTEDHVFRLLSLKLIEEPAETIQLETEKLKALQRDDGGWSQLPEMASDAYATATALYALHTAGGVATSDPLYQRGLRYLLDKQLEDGSWHVVSRSKPFQKYYETGFPHEKDQFISAAASGWATTAIALALEK
jgi:hypothetical protein